LYIKKLAFPILGIGQLFNIDNSSNLCKNSPSYIIDYSNAELFDRVHGLFSLVQIRRHIDRLEKLDLISATQSSIFVSFFRYSIIEKSSYLGKISCARWLHV